MLLKWIVVGSVQDYVPTDLVDAKGIGQDPIFLSKPSTVPKLPDTSTSTATSSSTTTTTTPTASNLPPGVTTTVRPRTRAGPRAGGQGASGSQVTPRSTTNRHATSTRGPPPTASSTTTTSSSSTAASPSATPSPSNPTILHDSTQTWTSQKVPVESTRPHVQVQTAKPTSPPLEHFKPCRDKDLAYCLNGGECFVIETLTGSHKNCRCKEGYQGVRCDQFLPKTDSILSDPTDHLGIEFMESEEIYKRQVLSVSCIAIGITLLGTICMALYYRNKRRREKLQAHLKSYSVSASGFVSKPNLRPQGNLQLQKYSKGNGSCPPRSAAGHNGFAQKSVPSAAHSKVQTNGKHHRSGSVSHSPDQRSRASHRAPSRRTPPISKGRLNHIGGPRDSGPAYQHLREVESSEREVESLKGRYSEAAVCEPGQDSYLNMQRPPCARRASPPRAAPVVPCSRLDGPTVRASQVGFRCPPLHHSATPPPYRTCSVPIIPSVQGHYDDTSCMQTGRGGSGVRCPAAPGDARNRPPQARRHSSSSSSSSSSPSSLSKGAVQREAVALLLDEAQQQLRVLAHAHRKQEETGSAYAVARETACFLSPAGGEVGGPALSGPPETRLVNPSREPHRDSASPCE